MLPPAYTPGNEPREAEGQEHDLTVNSGQTEGCDVVGGLGLQSAVTDHGTLGPPPWCLTCRGSPARLRLPESARIQTGVPARPVSRILVRHQVPPLARCDLLTGETDPRVPGLGEPLRVRAAGELVHVDVKKPGRIPDGGVPGSTVAEPAPPKNEGSAAATSTPVAQIGAEQ